MPGIFYRPLSRRAFFQKSSQVVAASSLLTIGARGLHGASAPSATSLHLALLSDTHIASDPQSEYRKFRPWDNLQRTVEEVRALQPEAVIHDGDVARLTGQVEDYKAAQGLLAPLAAQAPILLGLGNHDERENFLKVFTSDPSLTQKVPDKHVLVWEHPLLRVILLDSLLYVNKTPGLLGKAQRDWLDRFLAKADHKTTIVFVHHTLGDGDGELLDAERFLDLLVPYRKVKVVLYGHSHQYAYAQREGLHLVNLPAVGYNFNDKEPVGWVDARFGTGGVDLTLKAFGGNRAQDGRTTSLAWREG